MSTSERAAHRFFMYLGYFVAFVISIHAVYSLYLEFMPASHWFEYYDVRPVKPEYRIGEPITFEVDFEVKRESDMVYHDAIMCDINGSKKFHKVWNRISANPGHKVTARDTKLFSLYFVPERELTCYLHSDIVAEQKFGIKKVQEVDPRYKFKLVGRSNDNSNTKTAGVSE